ncbi:MAG: 5-(carboxyamino)imidazole ribonucleotide mutase [Euryarchaeota archaeon]|nr:5-(carboxyamino)imidazole ribonucleotide mutase [Euryarchaeota archaeon]
MVVAVVIGSESDRELAEKAEAVLKDFGVACEVHVASAHRTPEKVRKLAERDDVEVFIAIAGLSAALPGVIASHTVKPVIGVPREVKLLGLDALLAIAQLPPGVPVATVGIDNAKNAALLAVEILALKDGALREKLIKFREKMRSS